MSQLYPDKANPANGVMRDVLSVIADGYDSVRPGAGDCVREMATTKYPDEECVPCGICSTPTPMTGSKRCDRCWELERRIKADPELARKIINEISDSK